MISEEKIVEGCLAGKRKAYNVLYKRYASKMLGLCMRYSKSFPEAEDVLQEGFIKVFKNIDNFRRQGSLEGWIKRIMINTAIDNYQSSLKYYFHSDIDEIVETKILDGDRIRDDELQLEKISKEKLMELIQELPDGYRMVFNLFAIEGFSHRKIAGMLYISESTSKTQLLKARRRLKKQLKEICLKQENNILI